MRKEENVATFTISKKTEEEIAQKKTASEKTNPPSGAFNISKKTDSAPVYAPTLEEERANERDKMLTPSVSRQAGKTSAPQSAPKSSFGSRVTSGIMSGLITEGANIANAGGVQADLRGGTEMSGIYREQVHSLDLQIAALEKTLKDPSMTEKDRADTMEALSVARSQRDIYDKAVRSGEGTAKGLYETADAGYRAAQEYGEKSLDGTKGIERKILGFVPGATQIGAEIATGVAPVIRAISSGGANAAQYRYQAGDDYNAQDAATRMALSAAGVAAGSILSRGVNESGLKLLRTLGKQNYVLPNIALGGASALGYAAGETGLTELSKAITDENYTPDWNSIGKTAVSAFAFGAITRAIDTARVSIGNKRYMKTLNENVQERYNYAKRVIEDPRATAQQKAQGAKSVMDAADKMRYALDELQVVGAQKEVNAMQEFLLSIYGEMLPYTKTNAGGISGAGEIVPVTPAATPPAQVTPAEAAQLTVSQFPAAPSPVAPAAAGRAAIEATAPKTVVPAPVAPAPVQKTPDLPLASEQSEQKAQAGEITPSTADAPQNAAQSAGEPIANGFSKKQMERLSGTFGENGAKAFRTSMTDYAGDAIRGYAQFTKLYNEGKKRGKTVDTSPTEILKTIEETPELSPEQRYAAFVSGMNDASAPELKNIAPEPVAQREKSGYTELENRLSSYDTAKTDGMIYSINRSDAGFVVDIKRDDSRMSGLITNARDHVYHGGPFATRAEAVNDLLSVARNNFYREEGEINVNGVQKLSDGQGVLSAPVSGSGSRGLLGGVSAENDGRNESGRNTPADLAETRDGAVRYGNGIDRGTEDAGGRGVGVRERGDLQSQAGKYGLSSEQEHNENVDATGENERYRAERSETVRELQTHDTVQSEMQGVSAGNTGNDTAREMGSQGAVRGRQRNSVRAGEPTERENASLREEQNQVNEVPATAAEPAADRSEEVQREITQERADSVEPKGTNYVIPESGLNLPNGEKARFKANIAAIKTLRAVMSENRMATPQEQETLSRYVGWGGIANAFSKTNADWAKEYKQLKDLLSEKEWSAAFQSTQNAHFTSVEVIRAMYNGLKSIGFDGGRVLEPSCGVGNFAGAMPADLTAKMKSLTMVELDDITGNIAKALYPNASVMVQGFETAQIPDNYMDLAIGNVPFGNYSIFDKAYPKAVTGSIHNYFFGKSIDKVRPGGVLCFITSRYTMDARDSGIRDYMMKKADLLGAIRLPDTAFKGNAGTEVVTDILVFKKREPNTPYAGEKFDTVGYNHENIGVWEQTNDYFKAHPEMVLGTAEKSGTMYRSSSLTYKAKPGSLGKQIEKAFSKIKGRMDYTKKPTQGEIQETIRKEIKKADSKTKNGSYVKQNGKLYKNKDGELVDAGLNEKQAEIVTAVVDIRDTARQLLQAQQNDLGRTEIDALRNTLNASYDAFVKKNGPLHKQGNRAIISEDTDAPFILALEEYDSKAKTAKKAAIFTKDTITPHKAVDHVDNVADGFSVSINETGGVDIPMIARLLGASEKETAEKLVAEGLAFKQKDESYLPAQSYLSGNVRAKLKEARALANIDKSYQANVDALEKVVPKDIPAADISVRPGATWIPPQVYADFAAELLGGRNGGWSSAIDVTYSAITGAYKVEYGAGGRYLKGNSVDIAEYGTADKSFVEIFEAALNSKDLKVYYPHGKDEKAVVNPKATIAVKEKKNKILDKFQEWMWSDEKRVEEYGTLYNDLFNCTAVPNYDGSGLVVDGLAAGFTMREHQANAVQRIIMSGGNVLLAHGTGAGKTLEMASAAMKLRQIGAVRKPMIVVPKNLLGQWESEFRSYYPAAKLLVPAENDFTAKNRKTFANKIATGDYDAVIVTQEHFERIPLSAAAQTEYYQEQIEQIIAAEEESKQQRTGKSFTVKQLAKKKSQLEAKIKELADVARDEDNIEFESLGVDALFVDEAHGYKNLFYTTQMSHVADLGNKNGAKKSSDLYMKVQYLQKLNGGRGIVFGTATPVMNSVVEMYTMQRYLQGDLLNQKGIGSFDAWASEFGDVVEINKMRSDGKGYETKQSMSRYRNLGELQQLFRSFADVVTQAPGLKLPKLKTGGPIVVECDPSEAQEAYLEEIGKRADAIRSGRVDVKDDNILKVYGDGKKMSYTQRMIDTSLPYEDGGKILSCVANVLREYRENESTKGTQLIFCDRGVPGGRDEESGVFLYKDIKDLLVKGGIPENEIAFAQSYKTDKAKEQMKNAVNDGKIRVLIGSTQAMGTGLNVQKRAVASHELNAPDRPGDIEQNRGRIIRQGNMNDEVSIYTYITKRTFDSRQWDNLKRKGAFIHQVIAGDFNGRTADGDGDFSASAAEIAAIASDNPLIIEQNEVSQKIATLEALSQSHAKEVSLANRKLAELPGTIAKLKDVISNLKKDISARKDVSGANFTANVLGTQYTKASEAGAAIVQASKDILDMTAEQKSAKIGDVAGLDIYVSNHNTAFIKGAGAYDFNLNTESAEGTMSSALHTIKTLDARLTAAETNLSEKEKEIEKYEKISAAPFEKQAELNKLRAREDEIMAILNPQSEQGAFDGNGEGNGDYDGEADGADAFAYAENTVTPDRSDQWSAERVGDGKKPKRLAEIIEQIHHDFDVNITTGHIRGKNTLGKFSHRDQGIRARIANDLPTIAHELGHYFDFTYGLTKNGLSAKLKSELTDNLSDEMKAVYKKEKHVTEGLAEFMRKFLQNRETAAIDYPEFTAYFLGRLTPKDLALIEQLADDVNAYYSLDAETATSSIRFKEEKNPDARTTAEKIKDTSDRWYQDWVDALHSIKQFDDDTGSDVYKLAINSLYKDAVAGAIITGDLTDKNGQYVSPGLKDVLRGINLKDKEEYRLFNEYLVVKHGPERLSEGKRIFADDRKNSTKWMNDRAAALEAQHPQFKKAAERLYRFQRDFKKTWLVGTGLLSDEMSKDWDDRWEFYVPLNRAVDMQKRGIGAKRGFANQSNPIKRASERGSGLDIISPVDNIIDNIIRVVNAGMQNDVMLQLTNAAIRTGADATIMEKIPTPMKKTIFSLGGVKEQLGDAGDTALSEGKFDTKAFNQFNEIVSGLDDVIAQYSKGKSHDNIITVLRNGETEFWKINDPLLLSSLMNLSPARSNALLEMYGSITRFMTATATGTNVVWSITSNFPRDLQTLLVYSEGKNRLSVIPAMAKAYLNVFKKDNADPLYKEYLAMGGGQTSVYTADRNVARNMRAKLAGDKMRWLNPMEWIAFISETVESGPRYATYKLMREKGMTPQEAIYASHDITVNFRRGGVRSRELNKVIPFFNAGVQGLDKFARWQTAQDVPLNGRKSAARTRFFTFLAVNVALGALFYGINNADEEKKEDYQQLSNYTKNNYWLFPLGDGEYFAIPKARELSVLASFTETALERTVGGNKHAFDEFYDYVIDTTLPGLISDLAKGDWEGAVGTVGILGVGAYIMANRDFLGKPIESAGMQYLEAKDRYNNRTSKIAYALGQALDASPQKIDYFFQQTFGGFWKAQKALMPVGGENVDVTLGVQNQYIKDNQYSTDLVNWLYDKADASAKAKKSNPADMEKAITATMDDRMTSFYSNYNKASKGEESTASTRGTRQVVLTMINEYRKASDSGALTTAQKAVYAVCKQENSTDYLPSTMQPTVKDGAGKTHTLSGVDYVEFQLNYNRLYWEYVEDNINSGKSAAEKAAICTAAKSTAKADAINRIAASHGWAKTEDAEKFKGVNADAVVRFKAYLDIANDDKSLTQDEVIAAIDRLALSKEQSSTLFHSKYDSDKNNPYK